MRENPQKAATVATLITRFALLHLFWLVFVTLTGEFIAFFI